MRSTEQSRASAVINRIADRVDLAIDVLTLGQYGLERVPADGSGCGGIGRKSGWESRAHQARRRGACPEPAMSWDWPRARRDTVSG